MSLARAIARRLARTGAGRAALGGGHDLSFFRARPSVRLLTGLLLLGLSYLLGWPAVGLFSGLAVWLDDPAWLIGGPLLYGFSWLVFLAAMGLIGRETLPHLKAFGLARLERFLLKHGEGRETS